MTGPRPGHTIIREINERGRRILKEERYICVVGASNADIQGRPRGRLVPRDSNIGTVRISCGGVGRNIAENLARLGIATRLVSVVGDDAYGRQLLEEARCVGLDMSDTLVVQGGATSVYLCVLDEMSDMALAINDMDICQRITVPFIESKKHVIENATLCVLDTNYPADVLSYILRTFQRTTFFLDAVSAAKAVRVRHMIGRFHTIKPNRLEAEALSGITIASPGDLKKAAAFFHSEGVRQVFITLGKDGVFWSTREADGLLPAPDVKVQSATGAGDAFTAGLALGYLRGLDAVQSARLAGALAALTLMSESTVSPGLSPETLDDKAKELGLC